MGEDTKIEWARHTFNPWIGCTKVSPACAHCYAEVNTATRTRGVKWGAGQPRYRTSAANWKLPLKWDRQAGYLGQRHRVFCASLSDWLDDEVPVEWLADLLALIHSTPNLDWLLLTKRPENFAPRMAAVYECFSSSCRVSDEAAATMVYAWPDTPPANVWIGCTVENQEYANMRIPKLISIPARVRFLSCEPLLGPLTLREGWITRELRTQNECFPFVNWVITGGESGHHARPSHPDWFRSMRDQCTDAGVAFFFKQWGEFLPDENHARFSEAHAKTVDVRLDPDCVMMRVGKKAAGRLLDGREWNDVPGVFFAGWGGGLTRDAR